MAAVESTRRQMFGHGTLPNMNEDRLGSSRPYAVTVLEAAHDCGTLAIAFRWRRRVSDAPEMNAQVLERLRLNSLMRISDRFQQISTVLQAASVAPSERVSTDSRVTDNLTVLACLQQLEAAQELLRAQLAQLRIS